MFVFNKGEPWDNSPVSTGKKGNETPPGVFPLLQKKVMHRSNLYNDAPMPYMQRLTWDGVALHAGRVPGYPASHGCVRLPKEFAKKLYGVTRFHNTIVIVADEPVTSPKEARKLAYVPEVSDGLDEPSHSQG
jgi:lipoprotein-anchoring transpeptidase ErfK/SrfK